MDRETARADLVGTQLDLFSPDRLQVGEGMEALAVLDLGRALSVFDALVASYPDASDALHGLAVARRWAELLERVAELEPAAGASLLWRELQASEHPITPGLRRAVLEDLLERLRRGELELVPPDLCPGTVLLELGRREETVTALTRTAGLVHTDPAWLLVHANALWRLGLASRSRALSARALLLAPDQVPPTQLLDSEMRSLVERHGPLWAPVHGWLAGLIPFPAVTGAGQDLPPSPAVSALALLRAAEEARRRSGHDAMVAARRRLKEERPELFALYMHFLESGLR